MSKIIFYVALAIVGFLIFWKIRRRKGCGPKCNVPPKVSQSKEEPSYPKDLEKIRKRLGKKTGGKK